MVGQQSYVYWIAVLLMSNFFICILGLSRKNNHLLYMPFSTFCDFSQIQPSCFIPPDFLQ